MHVVSKILVIIAILATLNVSPAFAVDNYGAIAFSPSTGANGRAWDYRTRAQAERAALNRCRQYASDCRLLWFRNACGSFARGRNGGWGSAWHVNKRQAIQRAINSCRRHDRGCAMRVWTCTTR